uniref:Prostate and testis expressed 2 n=1 Tax=Rhinolophus ferrumequinum TaxID=59479 RepID=A0A671EIF5_RHIFE
MEPRKFQLLLGISAVLFMDEGVLFCNKCDHYNGSTCIKPMKSCWKINIPKGSRSCRTDHFYFSDRLAGRYLYRHSKLSCEPCEEGMFQVFHDLLRETFCCTDNDRCNDPDQIIDTTKGYVPFEQDRQ